MEIIKHNGDKHSPIACDEMISYRTNINNDKKNIKLSNWHFPVQAININWHKVIEYVVIQPGEIFANVEIQKPKTKNQNIKIIFN